MIVHNSYRRPVMVRVVNSRLPVYRYAYGNGVGDLVWGLFTRIAPMAAPLAKQLSMKSIDVIKDKAPGTIGNLASKAFSAIKDRLARLIGRKSVKLPSTEVMSANVSKVINQVANQRLVALINQEVPETAQEQNITPSLIAGSGLLTLSKPRRL